MRFAAPTMPKARARLEPTTSITVAPTTARTICVSMTGAERGGVPRRRGRNASAAPSAVATGSANTARSTMSKCDSRTCGRDCMKSDGGSCMAGSCLVGRLLIHGPRTDGEPVADLLLDLADESSGVVIGVVPGAESVVPLGVGERLQSPGGPSHVRGMDHGQQLFVAALVIEPHRLPLHCGDEAVSLEAVKPVAARIHLAS